MAILHLYGNVTEHTTNMEWQAANMGSADTQVLEAEPKTQVKKPPMFKVILLNDDFTPMDFVVQLLRTIFRRSEEEAVDIMLQIHRDGSGICGVYTRDVAETKADLTIKTARSHEYPLQCKIENE